MVKHPAAALAVCLDRGAPRCFRPVPGDAAMCAPGSNGGRDGGPRAVPRAGQLANRVAVAPWPGPGKDLEESGNAAPGERRGGEMGRPAQGTDGNVRSGRTDGWGETQTASLRASTRIRCDQLTDPVKAAEP
jgi:hypothetical protein